MAQTKARKKLYDSINGANGAQVLTAGGDLGTGNIAFTANPSANDTITVNGVVFTFTASASTTTLINIKGTLALTLAEAESVIESNADVGVGSGVIVNVDVTDTDTDLTFRFMPGAYVYAFASSTDGANTTDTAYVRKDPVVIDTNKSQILFEWPDNSSALKYVMLPDGTVDGQMVELYVVSAATAGDSIGVIGSYASSNSLLTLGGTTSLTAGDYAVLYYDLDNGIWKVKVSSDAPVTALEDAAI